MQGDQFDWWFDRNPAGSLMSVAVIDDEVVGVASHTLAQLRIAGEQRLGQYSVHAVTSERARGLGIFRALERHHEELGRERGSACVLAFASVSTRGLFLGPLGWSQIDHPRVWARPLRGMVERRLGRGGASSPAAAAWKGTQRLESFGPAQEAAYHELAPALGNHLIRDARYLQWRYFDSPKPYTAYASQDGFAVLGHAKRGRLATGLVMELLAPPDQAPEPSCALYPRGAQRRRPRGGPIAVAAALAPRPVRVRSGSDAARLHGHRIDAAARRASGRLDAVTRRYRLLLSVRLVFVTQRVDPDDPVLGATVAKIAALAARVDEVVVARRQRRARRASRQLHCPAVCLAARAPAVAFGSSRR